LNERFLRTAVAIVDLQTALAKARTEDLDGAIELARHVIAESPKPGRRFI
jgi:hypothetical protein